MKDSIERIVKNGNSSTLYELAKRVGNAAASKATTESMNVVAMTMLNHPLGEKAQKTRVVIEKSGDLVEGDDSTEGIEVRSGACDDPSVVKWRLDAYSGLKELVVGDDCLQCVKGFELSEFRCLEKAEIGARCFTKTSGCFAVSGCGVLRRFVIGKESCVKWSSFVMKDCDSIQEVSIGDGCFVNCENTVFESLSALTKLTIGKESFRGDEKKKSALVMKSEYCERE